MTDQATYSLILRLGQWDCSTIVRADVISWLRLITFNTANTSYKGDSTLSLRKTFGDDMGLIILISGLVKTLSPVTSISLNIIFNFLLHYCHKGSSPF